MQPFAPYVLKRCLLKSKKTIPSDNTSIDLDDITNDVDGLFEYLRSTHIKNKIKHPLYLALKFSNSIKLYYNAKFFGPDADDLSMLKTLIIKFQTYLNSITNKGKRYTKTNYYQDYQKKIENSHFIFLIENQENLISIDLTSKISENFLHFQHEYIYTTFNKKGIPTSFEKLKDAYIECYPILVKLQSRSKHSDSFEINSNTPKNTSIKETISPHDLNNNNNKGIHEAEAEDEAEDENSLYHQHYHPMRKILKHEELPRNKPLLLAQQQQQHPQEYIEDQALKQEYSSFNQAHYPLNQSLHPSNQAPHLSSQVHHPSNQAYHPSSQAHHPSNQPHHPSNQAYHSSNQAHHPSSQVHRPFSQAHHPLSQAPHPLNQAHHSSNQAHDSLSQAHDHSSQAHDRSSQAHDHSSQAHSSSNEPLHPPKLELKSEDSSSLKDLIKFEISYSPVSKKSTPLIEDNKPMNTKLIVNNNALPRPQLSYHDLLQKNNQLIELINKIMNTKAGLSQNSYQHSQVGYDTNMMNNLIRASQLATPSLMATASPIGNNQPLGMNAIGSGRYNGGSGSGSGSAVSQAQEIANMIHYPNYPNLFPSQQSNMTLDNHNLYLKLNSIKPTPTPAPLTTVLDGFSAALQILNPLNTNYSGLNYQPSLSNLLTATAALPIPSTNNNLSSNLLTSYLSHFSNNSNPNSSNNTTNNNTNTKKSI